MKFKYLTLLIMISYFSYSQNNLFNSTENWSISSYNVNMFCITNDVYSSFLIGDTIVDIGGDTILNVNNYCKLYKSGNRFNQSGCPALFNYYYSNINQNILIRYFDKKIYFIDLNDLNPKENIFLDYNLNIGDTIKNVGFTKNFGLNYSFIVNTIDSVLIDSNYHKIFNFLDQYNSQHFLIEKLGSSFGFIDSFVDFEHESHLNCYSSGGIVSYISSNCSDPNCILTTLLNNHNENNLISINPNPTNGILTINYPQREYEAVYVYVKDIFGNEISKYQLSENQNYININYLNSGIYFFEFKTPNCVLVKKIIKE